METGWALARALGYLRNAAAAPVAAEDRSGESLFLAAECLDLEGLFAEFGVVPESPDDNVGARESLERAVEVLGGSARPSVPLVLWAGLQALRARAASSVRVMDAVRVEPVWLDDTLSVRDVLDEVVQGRGRPPSSDSGAVRPASVRSRPVLAIATRLGAIADLLSGEAVARTDVDRAAAAGLPASVLAVLHVVAVATLAALGDHSGGQSACWLMRGVLALGSAHP